MKILDEIRGRLEAATPGPWQWSPEEDVWGDCGPNLETVERGPIYSDGSQGAEVQVIGSWGHDANGISVEDADKEFIAHAPSDVAVLLDFVRRATSLIRDLTDPDECSFDHHGGCQAHGYLSLEPGETCPQQEAKNWSAAMEGKA